MTYLTAISLTSTEVPVQLARLRSWTDQDAVHKAIMSLFPTELSGAPGARRASSGILYRVEAVHGRHRVLLQSQVRPSVGETKDISAFLSSLSAGDELLFRLQVNAVSVDSKTRRRRAVPLVDFNQWLTKRLKGFEEIELIDSRAVPLCIGRGEKQIPLHTVIANGRCSVDDSTAAVDAIKLGIGRAKAYGCGLFSVVRV